MKALNQWSRYDDFSGLTYKQGKCPNCDSTVYSPMYYKFSEIQTSRCNCGVLIEWDFPKYDVYTWS